MSFVLFMEGLAVEYPLAVFIALLLFIAGLDGVGVVLLPGVVGVFGLSLISLPAVSVALVIVELIGLEVFSMLVLEVLGLTDGRVVVLPDGLLSLTVLALELGSAAAIVSYLWLKLTGVKSLSPELLRELWELSYIPGLVPRLLLLLLIPAA